MCLQPPSLSQVSPFNFLDIPSSTTIHLRCPLLRMSPCGSHDMMGHWTCSAFSCPDHVENDPIFTSPNAGPAACHSASQTRETGGGDEKRSYFRQQPRGEMGVSCLKAPLCISVETGGVIRRAKATEHGDRERGLRSCLRANEHTPLR